MGRLGPFSLLKHQNVRANVRFFTFSMLTFLETMPVIGIEPDFFGQIKNRKICAPYILPHRNVKSVCVSPLSQTHPHPSVANPGFTTPKLRNASVQEKLTTRRADGPTHILFPNPPPPVRDDPCDRSPPRIPVIEC